MVAAWIRVATMKWWSSGILRKHDSKALRICWWSGCGGCERESRRLQRLGPEQMEGWVATDGVWKDCQRSRFGVKISTLHSPSWCRFHYGQDDELGVGLWPSWAPVSLLLPSQWSLLFLIYISSTSWRCWGSENAEIKTVLPLLCYLIRQENGPSKHFSNVFN